MPLPYLTQADNAPLRVSVPTPKRENLGCAIGFIGRFSSYSQEQRTERLDLNLQLAQAYAFTGALPKASQMLQDAERSG